MTIVQDDGALIHRELMHQWFRLSGTREEPQPFPEHTSTIERNYQWEKDQDSRVAYETEILETQIFLAWP